MYVDKQMKGVFFGFFLMILGTLMWPAVGSLIFYIYGLITIVVNLIFNSKGDRWLIPGFTKIVGKETNHNTKRKRKGDKETI
jgi:hypothetical protein